MAKTRTLVLVLAICLLTLLLVTNTAKCQKFLFNGFDGASAALNGGAVIEHKGLLHLTNNT